MGLKRGEDRREERGSERRKKRGTEEAGSGEPVRQLKLHSRIKLRNQCSVRHLWVAQSAQHVLKQLFAAHPAAVSPEPPQQRRQRISPRPAPSASQPRPGRRPPRLCRLAPPRLPGAGLRQLDQLLPPP